MEGMQLQSLPKVQIQVAITSFTRVRFDILNDMRLLYKYSKCLNYVSCTLQNAWCHGYNYTMIVHFVAEKLYMLMQMHVSPAGSKSPLPRL
jgi:hypothetical protein